MSRRRRHGDDRRAPLPGVEASEQPPRQVLLGRRARAAPRAVPRHAGGVRPEEGRRRRDEPSRCRGEVEREVMALEAPRPGLSSEARRRAQVVELRVAQRDPNASVSRRIASSTMTPGRLLVPPRREGRPEHRDARRRARHSLSVQRDPVPPARKVAPGRALLAVERAARTAPPGSDAAPRGNRARPSWIRPPRPATPASVELARTSEEAPRRAAAHGRPAASRSPSGPASVRCTGQRSAISIRRRFCSSDRGPRSEISRSIRSIRPSLPRSPRSPWRRSLRCAAAP